MSEHHPAAAVTREDWRWLLVVQGLSLFNDNLFRQLVLLRLVAVPVLDGSLVSDGQGAALIAFALPFLVLSSLAGQVADRFEKRAVLVAVKASEVPIMALGAVALSLSGPLGSLALVVVLFAMAAQTAFMVPVKYGLLPALVSPSQLPRANAWMQVLAYAAMMGGIALAGGLLTVWGSRPLWIGGCCVALAVAGLAAALRIRPVASPPAAGRWERASWLVPWGTWQSVRQDRLLADTLLVYAFFWWLAGTIQPAVNSVGRLQLRVSDAQTSGLLAASAAGVVIGCLVAGWLCRDQVPARLLWWVAVGMGLLQTALGCPGAGLIEQGGYPGAAAGLAAVGVLSGMFVVPLHVQVQLRAAATEKGRVMALQNWMNWIAVLLSGGSYAALRATVSWWQAPPSVMFFLIGLISLGGLCFFAPGNHRLIRWPTLVVAGEGPVRSKTTSPRSPRKWAAQDSNL
jgi:MFS family permease